MYSGTNSDQITTWAGAWYWVTSLLDIYTCTCTSLDSSHTRKSGKGKPGCIIINMRGFHLLMRPSSAPVRGIGAWLLALRDYYFPPWVATEYLQGGGVIHVHINFQGEGSALASHPCRAFLSCMLKWDNSGHEVFPVALYEIDLPTANAMPLTKMMVLSGVPGPDYSQNRVVFL